MIRRKYKVLKNASPCKAGKRFAAFFVDFLLVFVVATIIFTFGCYLTRNSASYIENQNVAKEEASYYKTYTASTHLSEFVDEETQEEREESVIIYQNICRAIVASYNIFGNDQNKDFTLNESVSLYGQASQQLDNISYFYTQYVPAHNENNAILDFKGVTPTTYLFNIYQEFLGDYSEYYVYNEENGIPVLTTRTAYLLKEYLFGDEEASYYDEGTTIYQNIASSYSSMLDDAKLLMLYAEPYYSSHYICYIEAITIQSKMMNITLILSIILSALLAIMLPKIIYRDGTTLGRRMFHMGAIKTDLGKVPLYSEIIRSLISAIGYLMVAVIIYILPPFYFNYDLMSMPFKVNGKMSLGLILLIIGFIYSINAMPILFTHRKQSFLDMAFQEVIVDGRALNEGDIDEMSEASPI